MSGIAQFGYNQLLAADNSFPWYFKWNIIQDAGNPNYVIYCRDVKNLRYDVRNNCWGEKFNPDEDFYPAPSFTWFPVWDCGINADGSSTGSAPRVAYETSLEQIANEDYAAAETQLQLIVETWPDSKYAATALKTMPDVAVKRNNIDQLINYLNTNATIQADEELKKLAGYLSADCDVIKANYQQALDFYAGIIDNPPTVEDSIYAQIDAGRVHFLMEQEGNKAPVTFKYQHIIPKSHAAYSLKRKQLLDEIGGAVKPQTNELQTADNLNQQAFVDAINIYPNPVFDELNVELFSKTEGTATFSIYSSTGRCVYTNREELTDGKDNSYVVETKEFAQGVYLLQVNIDGSQVYSRRFIINR